MKKNLGVILSIALGFSALLLTNGFQFDRVEAGSPQQETREGVPGIITYQGQLKVSNVPYTGICKFNFGIYDALNFGNLIGDSITQNIYVTQGIFTTELDFGSDVFTGDARWMKITVVCPHDGLFSFVLSPRQPITPAPYAITALGIPGLYTQMASYSPNLIGGYSGNWVTNLVNGATIGGGGTEGYPNRVTTDFGTVGGGWDNQAGGAGWTPYATVSGGNSNTASGESSTVGGGWANIASDTYSTVGGGSNNVASGFKSTIPGGYNNLAEGDLSFAAGYGAKAYANGCFVWGDSSPYDVSCNTTDSWVARATGGVYFYSDTALTSGVVLYPHAGAWSTISDRNLKENINPVDTQQLLESLAQIPITTWNYKGQDDSVRHIGPMAQDFYSAFGLGENDTHISTIDPDGVALAAIQELYAENQELKAQIDDIEARLTKLESSSQSVIPAQSSLSPTWLFVISLAAIAGIWISRRQQGAYK